MKRRTPSSTGPYPLFPDPTLFRSENVFADVGQHRGLEKTPAQFVGLAAHGDFSALVQGIFHMLFYLRDSGIVDKRALRDFVGEAVSYRKRGYLGGELFDEAVVYGFVHIDAVGRSEEHTSELQSLMRISYDVFCLKKKNKTTTTKHSTQ